MVFALPTAVFDLKLNLRQTKRAGYLRSAECLSIIPIYLEKTFNFGVGRLASIMFTFIALAFSAGALKNRLL